MNDGDTTQTNPQDNTEGAEGRSDAGQGTGNDTSDTENQSHNTKGTQDAGETGTQDQGGGKPQVPEWVQSLPEDIRDKVSGHESPEAMVKEYLALKEQAENAPKPVEKAEELELTAPQGLDVPEDVMGWLKNQAVERGFSAGQTQDLLNEYAKLEVLRVNAMVDETHEYLKNLWQSDYDNRVKAANATLAKLDAKMDDGGRFKAWATSFGGLHKEVWELLDFIGRSIGESSMPGGQGGATAAAVTPEQYIKDQFGQ